uniref:DNA-binding protein RFX2-like isoform X2 n=1 Tax=Styela clava TaxID=7725 RepID=UPI00193992C5|nr:DNA-binding protein RFX2-like isoform X2 [Styela clava]
MNISFRWATVASRQNAIATVVLETVTRCIMQQAASVQVASSQQASVVTVPHNQIPVAQYVSVTAGKQDLNTSDAGKQMGGGQGQMPCKTEEEPRPAHTAVLQQAMDLTINSKVKTERHGSMDSKTMEFVAESNILKTVTIRRVDCQSPPVKLRVLDLKKEADIACQILQIKQEKENADPRLLQQVYQGGQIQYVESPGDHIYANGSGATSYQYTDGTQLYTNSHSQNTNSTTNALFFDTSVTGHQPTMVSSLQAHHAQLQAGAASHHNMGQIVATPTGGTYIIRTPGGAAGGEGILAMPINHNTRASPATVQWLMEHFENSEGVSLPRALMYHHYLLHCREQTLDPVNAASFGKLVRSVFMGLRTRRLGTRGNSKYHYYGIRIKASSPLNRLQEEVAYAAMRHPGNHAKRAKVTHSNEKMETTESGSNSPGTNAAEQVQHHQKFLGDVSQAIPDLDPIQFDRQTDPFPDGVTQDDLSALEDLYRDHCSGILDIIVTLQFPMVDELWHTFWRSNKPMDAAQLMNDEMESKLSHNKLLLLCSWKPVQKWVKDCDHLMYQSLVDVLIPDVLRPIPSALTQAIRNFAKGLEASLSAALTGGSIPENMVRIKTTAVSAFSQTLRRYTSLNHLAQAARAVLHNGTQINQMLSDLNRVDFTNVQEQASWVCQCDAGIVKRLETEFKAALSEQRTLEQWAEWLESVVHDVLRPHEESPRFTKAARQFLLKWCFYSSMVIRDLTLRSAASFGSFHLIRLLYDEYMFYLVEHRVAQATGDTPIAVMSDFSDLARGEMNDLKSGVGQDDAIRQSKKNDQDRFITKASPS